MADKTIHIHLGPHKTGSTAIQRSLRENAKTLKTGFGLTLIKTRLVRKAAGFLNSDRLPEAAETLGKVAGLCAAREGDCVISCEDLSGALPGSRQTQEIYPHLWRNISILEDAFDGFDRRYYFFLRQPDDWLRSVYVQNLKHRQKFSRFEKFADFLQVDDLWDAVIAEPVAELGRSFVTVDYAQDAARSSVRDLLAAVAGCDRDKVQALPEPELNLSPGETDIALMQQINRSSASQEAKRRAKLALFEAHETPPSHAGTPVRSDWFQAPQKPETLPEVLEPLWQRVRKRVAAQDQPNLMPDIDIDLRPLRNLMVEADGDFPDVNRDQMAGQAEILIYRFRGQSEICFLLGLAISYLRRDTPHTAQASALFQRLWAEEYDILLGFLPTRWLISSFQTFLDHGVNADQRIIGSGAYFYANILKAYEAERAFEGLPPDAVYPHKLPQTKMGFAGLDRFKLGGSDLILNTNALLLEYSARDDTAGRVAQEFLARARTAQSIFSRMDKSRQAHEINIKQFSNCWSFFQKP
ncbi:hypothetical protein [Roseovarius aestuarii]|uniref:Sulfotransferase family protein n=1 Tax=Roseovarius aestuarii TaxID=475083 RepID=A0A1X7BRZ1_9RHOB|nr:hypothetical protein [Roseovarius aestuarii]SMC12466.1 hypothetical protein ROA7745_02292 [Roseovarius aestuarii]